MKNLILCAACLLLYGCMTVPPTEVSFDPKTQAIKVKSPKDVEIESASASSSNGVFYIEVRGYKSKNNLEVIRAVVTANAESRKAIEENGAKLVGEVIGAMK